MRSQEEIIKKIESFKNDPYFSTVRVSLAVHLRWGNAKPYIDPDIQDEDEWDAIHAEPSTDHILYCMFKILKSALNKAVTKSHDCHRIMIIYSMWVWLLEEEGTFGDVTHYTSHPLQHLLNIKNYLKEKVPLLFVNADDTVITSSTNFIRIFKAPMEYPEEYCHGGGIPVNFQMVDWFNPYPQSDLNVTDGTVVLDPLKRKELNDLLKNFIKGKTYYSKNEMFLAITNYGDSFMVLPETAGGAVIKSTTTGPEYRNGKWAEGWDESYVKENKDA